MTNLHKISNKHFKNVKKYGIIVGGKILKRRFYGNSSKKQFNIKKNNINLINDNNIKQFYNAKLRKSRG